MPKALDAYKKKKKEIEDIKNSPQTPEVKGKSLNEILHDESENDLYGALLEREGHQEIASRLAAKNLQPGDFAILEKTRLKHTERMKDVENFEATMTADYIENLASNNKDLENLVNTLGPDGKGAGKVADIVKDQLRELSVKDPKRFEQLSKKIKGLQAHEASVDSELAAKIKGLGVSSEDVAEGLAIEDEKERRKFLQKKIRASKSGLEKIGSLLKGISKKEAAELAKHKSEMDKALAQLNDHLGDVGKALNLAINRNPEIKQAFTHEILGESAPEKEQRASFTEAVKQQPMTEKDMDHEWQLEKKAKNFDTVTDAGEKQKIVDDFRGKLKSIEEKKTPEKKIGFWQKLLSKVFDALVANKDFK